MPEDLTRILGALPPWVWYVVAALAAVWLLKKLSTEERRPGRPSAPAGGMKGKERSREEQWPRIADGLVRLYRGNPAIRVEAGVPYLSESGRELLEASGMKELVDSAMEEMIRGLGARQPENHDEVLRWAVAAVFETDPGDKLARMEGFIKQGSEHDAGDMKLLGVLGGIYLRDEYMERKGLR